MPTCAHCKSEISWEAMQVLSKCRCGAPLPLEISPFEASHPPKAKSAPAPAPQPEQPQRARRGR